MEPANIDWKNIESRYVKDDVYEHINAPKWLDLSSSDTPSVDDDAWFCRPDCRHPKTAEDFQRWTPSPNKMKPSRCNSDLSPLAERNSNASRDGATNLKRRGGIAALLPSSSFRDFSPKKKANSKKFREDLENQDPNLLTSPCRPNAAPLTEKAAAKKAIKSSAEKGRAEEEEKAAEWENKKPAPQLKSTLSARNLFSGKDILGQISEFCHEIKKLAVGREKKKPPAPKVEEEPPNSQRNDETAEKNSKLTVKVDTSSDKPSSSVLREVRASPPTPQRFPSPSSHLLPKAKPAASANSPLNKPAKSLAPERGILQELDENKEKSVLVAKEEDCDRPSVASESEGSSMDMFWFLKPCTYLAK